MVKKLLVINMILISFVFSGCASFHETYKPLYQAKPVKESIRGEKI